MHFVRRAALRAASSPSTSFISQSRSITSSPFALRSKAQASIAQSIPRRFFSDEKSGNEGKEGEQSQGTVAEAVNAAKEYVSETVDSAKGAFASVAETASENAPRSWNEDRGGDRRSGGYQGRDNGRERRLRTDDRRGGFGDRGDRGARFPPVEVKPTANIYVGNLLFDVAATDLEREFGQFGTVQRSFIATDDRGLSKGFGYVFFETVEQATAAIEAKHQSVFEGRRIVVNYMLETNRSRAPTDPTKTLFIGNIPFEMSDADLNKLFRDIQNVVDVRVAIDRRTGQPRGFAHADFKDVESAVAGKAALVDKELYGRQLRVDYSVGARGRDSGEPRE